MSLTHESLVKAFYELIKKAVTELSPDVVKALENAYEREENVVAKKQLEAILTNIKLAGERKLPMCQDTGIQTFYIEAGFHTPHLEKLKPAITEAVRKATADALIRPNTVNPFTGVNEGDNTGRYIPYISWELVEGNEIRVYALPKGGGSENMCKLGMLRPGEGIKGVKRFVVEAVASAGGKPCPPVILGVGIGGGADLALKLGKKALLRPLGRRNPDERIAKLERELLEEVNSLGIGPMGLGGKTTALDILIEWAHRHPASLPVGVVFQCWADRKAFITIKGDGEIEWR